MREFFPSVVGNALLKERLAPKAREGLPHAVILEGAKGAGKRTLALALAMAAVCENRENDSVPLPCGTCRSCRRIKDGLSPDVIRLARPEGKATMGVEVIRHLREEIRVLPNDLEQKIYIIEDADTMTTQAQNALLLTLEEPPSFVLFILLATDAALLLETIRSRAPIYRLQPVTDEEMTAYFKTTSPAAARLFEADPDTAGAILKLSLGSIGKAALLFDSAARTPQIEARKKAESVCRLLSGKTHTTELLMLFLSFPAVRDELSLQLSICKDAFRDLALLTKSESAPLIFFTDRESAAELSEAFPTERILHFIDATDEAITALSANANTKLTLVRLFDQLTTH